MENRSPLTEELLKVYSKLTEGDLKNAMGKAREAFLGWSPIPLAQRLKLIGALRRLIIAQIDEIVDLLRLVTGKTRVEALINEIFPTLDAIRFYEKQAASILKTHITSRRLTYPNCVFSLEYHPLGVILILSPRNFPFQLSLIPMVTALAAGNSVVLKPSEATPGIGELISGLLGEARFPPDLVQVIFGDGETGEQLIAAQPDFIFLTGSTTAGKRVMKAAANGLIPVLLELGGKGPMIVFEDANFERAVNGAVYGAFANAGQVCVSVERVYVQNSIYEAFAHRVAEKARSLGVGLTDDDDIGAINSPSQIEIIKNHIEDAKAKGAILMTEFAFDDGFVKPVVLKDANHTMKIMREETFGPVLPLMPFQTEEEAIRLANDSPYGLNASIWTRDLRKARPVASRLLTGSCAINDVIKNIGNPRLPFGGIKQSGFGRYHGAEGLRAFSRQMSVMVNKGQMVREINWFPYSSELFDNLKNFIRIIFGDWRQWPGWLNLFRTIHYFRRILRTVTPSNPGQAKREDYE
ncbi:MAG: aldehyde dehydrogenase family protein [Desulfobacteraceae bacterium]